MLLDTNNYNKACKGKMQYSIRKKALKNRDSCMNRAKQRYGLREKNKKMNVYECPFCGFFHFGNTKKKE